MGRIIKFIWIISLVSGLAVLLYTYASLGEVISLSADSSRPASFTREAYFYAGLAILVIFNFSFYALSRNMHMQNSRIKQGLISWQLGFAAVLNFFFITAALFIMLFNSGERFNYDNFGYLIYVALVLVGLWIVALPVVIIRNRRNRKILK